MVAGAEMRVRDTESRVPAPRPSRRVRRKRVTRALRGVRARRDQRPEPREKARLRSAAGRLPPPAQPRFPVPASAGAREQPAPGRRRRNAEGGVRRARLPGLRSRRSHFLAAPGPSQLSARPSHGLASRPPILPRPSPSSNFLPFPPPSLPSLPSLPARIRVPGSAWLPRCEAAAFPGPKASLTPSSPSPDPALAQRDRRRKGDPRSCLEPVPRPRRSLRGLFPPPSQSPGLGDPEEERGRTRG